MNTHQGFQLRVITTNDDKGSDTCLDVGIESPSYISYKKSEDGHVLGHRLLFPTTDPVLGIVVKTSPVYRSLLGSPTCVILHMTACEIQLSPQGNAVACESDRWGVEFIEIHEPVSFAWYCADQICTYLGRDIME